MAKTKLNNTKRYEIKKIINQYIKNEFEKDERFAKFKEKIPYFTDLAQKEYNKVAGITPDVKKFLELTNMWGSISAYSTYYPYYQLNIEIQGCYGYNCSFDLDKLSEDYPYLKDNYRSSCSSSSLANSYLQSLEEFATWLNEFEKLNDEYRNLDTKMDSIVDNCKYLEDVKEFLPINEVIKYVDEALYNCNTFISVVTDADINLVKNFINKNKNNA
jgi:hypothetical protein